MTGQQIPPQQAARQLPVRQQRDRRFAQARPPIDLGKALQTDQPGQLGDHRDVREGSDPDRGLRVGQDERIGVEPNALAQLVKHGQTQLAQVVRARAHPLDVLSRPLVGGGIGHSPTLRQETPHIGEVPRLPADGVWSSPQNAPALVGMPQTRILELVAEEATV